MKFGWFVLGTVVDMGLYTCLAQKTARLAYIAGGADSAPRRYLLENLNRDTIEFLEIRRQCSLRHQQ